MTKGLHTPCDHRDDWHFWMCPSNDVRCGGCPSRPAPPGPELEIAVGGEVRLSRQIVGALARALGVRRHGDALSDHQVERILERWVELRHFGGGPGGAMVGGFAHGEPGALLWVATVETKIWREPREYVSITAQDRMPVVHLVAMLRYYEMPHLRASADAEERAHQRTGSPYHGARGRVHDAELELARLTRTTQYRAAMRRLAGEFSACPWEFLRVALGSGLEVRR